jgi:hypothetical protein
MLDVWGELLHPLLLLPRPGQLEPPQGHHRREHRAVPASPLIGQLLGHLPYYPTDVGGTSVAVGS